MYFVFFSQGRHFSSGHHILENLSSTLDAKYAQMTYGELYRKVRHDVNVIYTSYYCYCYCCPTIVLLLLLRIRSAHLEILRFPMGSGYAEKADLSKCPRNPKRKLGVTTHFSEIIKLQFGKERHTLLCILKLFNIDLT